MNTLTPAKLISHKDIMIICDAPKRTAERLLTDIRKHFKTKKPTYQHLRDYLKI